MTLDTTAPDRSANDDAETPTTTWRVLIADDDASIRSLLRELLSDEGYEIAEVKSGAEVLRAVPKVDPNLLILDLRLPDMDGIEVLRRLGKGGLTARPIADGEVGGKAAKGFALSDADGHVTEFWVDAATGLPVKIAYTSAQGRIEIVLKDYRAVSGIQVPGRIEQWREGNLFLEANYTDIQVNVDVDPKLFEKPAA